MKVVILAGGRGSRLGNGAEDLPKALVRIGDHPILWHVMALYASQGFRDFVIALGHRGSQVRDWLAATSTEATTPGGPWTITPVDTGEETTIAGRIRRVADGLRSETFMLTWCDGLADIDLRALVRFHRSHGRLATVTAVHRTSRFGLLTLEGPRVRDFREKPRLEDEWISGGFFVLEPGVLDRLEERRAEWHREFLPALARADELRAFRHESWWECMDTSKDAETLARLWDSGAAPWKLWD